MYIDTDISVMYDADSHVNRHLSTNFINFCYNLIFFSVIMDFYVYVLTCD